MSGRVAAILDTSIFYLVLSVVVLTAIPYGTVDPWLQAAFKCLIFGLTILWVIEGLLSRRWFVRQHGLLIPLLVLVAFALIQIAVPIRSGALSNRISFSPNDTKLVAQMILALVCLMGLLIRYTNTRKRLTTLVYVAIGIGLGSAIFGLLRKTFQHGRGFLLPALPLDQGGVGVGVGFAQFINHNHFAFLAEMSLGLLLGLMLIRPIRPMRFALCAAAVIPMWVTVVYANSRAGVASILGQTLFMGLIVFVARPGRVLLRVTERRSRSKGLFSFLAVRIILIAASLVLMVVAIGWVGGERFAEQADSVSNEIGVPDSDKYTRTLRSTIWPMTWELIKDHPVTGSGFGAYWIAITRYHHGSGEMTPQQAHNDYLELLASSGLIGVGLTVWFFIILFKELGSQWRDFDPVRIGISTGALAGMLAVAIHSVFDFGLHITINSVVILTLIVIAIAPIASAKERNHLAI